MNWEEVKNTDDFAPTWDFEADGELVGKYLGKRTGIGKYKKTVYSLELENGDKVEMWGSTVLDNKLAGTAEGAMVKIQYLGKASGKNGSYHDYAVFIGN